MPPLYTRRAVLFLDLLGFRNLVNTGKGSEIVEALRLSEASGVQFKDGTPSDIDFRISAFSDCVVCSAKLIAKNNLLPASAVASYAGRLALEMLSRGILVRGAITIGNLFHDDHTVFGPALIDAYELESQVALYPRIIVPSKVFGGINMSLSIIFGVEWWMQHQPFCEDFDGIYHLDIFGPFFMDERPVTLRVKTKCSLERLGPITSRLVKRVCRTRHKDPRIATKYEWLRHYLDECCERFGWEKSGHPRNPVHRRVRELKASNVNLTQSATRTAIGWGGGIRTTE